MSMRNVALLCGMLLCGMPGAGSAMAQGVGGRGQGDPAIAMGGRGVQGTVTAVAPDKLTVKTQNGEMFAVVTSANTTVRKGREPMKLADVHVGDGVGAMGTVDSPNKTVHALYLFVVGADELKKAQENLGKTYITGKVTAMNDLKLTVMRPDGVAQTIAVDEDTSFKRGGRAMSMMAGMGGGGGARPGGGAGQAGSDPTAGPAGGESITLADVKVGDTVMGQGSMKGGVFVPTQLNVSDASSQRRRREQTPGTAPAAGAPGDPK